MQALPKLTALCIAGTLAACSTEPDPVPPAWGDEDCQAAGDEDGNGVMDCEDPACAGAASCPGGFTLSAESVAFSMKLQGQLPLSQVVRLHATDDRTAAAGAAYVAPQRDPGWLRVTVTGTAPDFDVALGVTTSEVPPGTQPVVLTLGTMDAAGNVLQLRTLQVSLTTLAPVRITTPAPAHDFTLGHSSSSATTTLDVTADAMTRWRLTASQPWIAVPADARTGPGPASITVDASSLGIGQHTGSVTAVNTADPTDLATVAVKATVAAPILSVSPDSLIVGGADGLEMVAGQPLQISLGTGAAAHPWSATLTTDTGGAWLRASAASGMASGTPTTIDINADRALVAPGRYTGTVRIEAVVRGERLSRSVPIVFHKEGHWLHVSSLGVAFSSFPGRSVLTRTLQVRSSRGRTDVPWTAQSDQSWLSVTPGGMTGGALTLTANPAGLQSNRQYFARVTVSSSDGSILNQESVRVGLRIGATDPLDINLAAAVTNVVANPVEPHVYVNAGSTHVAAYDVYGGTVARTFASVVASAGEMVVSSDGAILFVNDMTNRWVVALDTATGAVLRRYPWIRTTGRIAYARPHAHPVLLIGASVVYDVATGVMLSEDIDRSWYPVPLSVDVDPFSQHVYMQNTGISASTLRRYSLTYTALRDYPIVTAFISGGSGGSNGQDLCVSADGSLVYTANGSPYNFPAFSTSSLAQLQTLAATAYPNNTACGWNGLFFGGASVSYDPVNVWVYRPDGTRITSFAMTSTTYKHLRPDTLVLSGDNTRVMAATEGVPGSDPSSFNIRTAPSP